MIGFATDTLKFYSFFNFETYTSDYALSGKTTKVKECFGQLIDSGNFNIYMVLLQGTMQLQAISNDSANLYASYPVAVRMKDKRYEAAKENLYVFFKDYPAIIEKIKSYKQQDDFFEIINLMKTLN